jgi:nucleotide-binding universal stress UspA family protein
VYTQIIVPFNGTDFSARAITLGRQLCRAMNAPLRIVSFAHSLPHYDELTASVKAQLASIEGVDVSWTVRKGDPVEEIAAEWSREPGALVCMSSVGRSRSAPILGSVAGGVLQEMYGPVLLLGPHAHAEAFRSDGAMIVCSDGSTTAAAIMPVAAQWAITLPLEPWVVAVFDPATQIVPAELRGDVATDDTHAWHLAHRLALDIGRPVQHDALHSSHTSAAVARFASDEKASLIAMSTHGATGLRRVALGSVAMAVVHCAPCPVLVYRPVHLPTDGKD